MQKKLIVVAAGFAVVAAGTYLGAHLWAQTPGQTPAPSQTRVAFVNMMTVIQKYEKAQFFKTEYDAVMKEFREKTEKLNKYMVEVKEYIGKNAATLKQDERTKFEKGILSAKRQLEDMNLQYGKKFKSMNERQTPQIYKEIEQAVQAYAKSNGFHAVFSHYSFDGDERTSMRNIIRVSQGMQGTGCVMSMYVAPGLDVSEGVADTLNRAYRASGGSTNLKPASFNK